MTRPQIDDNSSFVNNFWGHKDAGFQVIQQRIKHSSTTLQELLQYYSERVAIEKEYNKKLLKLNEHVPLGSSETGTLKQSLDKMAMENYQMIKYNMKFAKTVTQQNYEKLKNFTVLFEKKIVKLENHMSKLAGRRADAYKQYVIYKNKYKDECQQIKSLRFQCQGTWGKELERLEVKLNKILGGNGTTRKNYIQSCTQLQELEELYARDWATILKDFYQLEAERIQICKVNCFAYCNNVATLCVEHDQAVDNVRSVFAVVSPNDDLAQFSAAYGTGNRIYHPPEFVDFMQGLEEKPEDDKYTLANFENPEYLVRSQSMHVKTGAAAAGNDGGIVTSSPKAKPYTPSTSPIKMPPSATTTPSPTKFTSRIQYPQKKPQQPQFTEDQYQSLKPSQQQQQQSQSQYSPSNSPMHPLPAAATTLEPVNLPPPTVSPYGGKYAKEASQFGNPKTPSPTRREPQNTRATEHLEVLQQHPHHHHHHQSHPSVPSNYSSNGSTDVFSMNSNNDKLGVAKQTDKFRESNGSSNYSNPTTYTSSNYSSNYSSNSNEHRNWATPRKKEIEQVKKFQDRINLNAKELPTFPESQMNLNKSQHNKLIKDVPIQKDFSIDFIAKALEDLNSGGNGDINQYRRSVRRAREEENSQKQSRYSLAAAAAPTTPFNQTRPAADYVDDHDEVATRYGSINFTAPSGVQPPQQPQIQHHKQQHSHSSQYQLQAQMQGHQTPSAGQYVPSKSGSVRRRPKSMYESSTNNDFDADESRSFYRQHQHQHSQPNGEFTTPRKSTSKPQRSLSKTPSKSYTNLHSFIQDTPAKPTRNDSGFTPSGKPYVAKVKAMYTYKPQHHGELYFKKNWYMYVLHKQEDNWFVCELASEPGAGTVGLVPGNYVKDDLSF